MSEASEPAAGSATAWRPLGAVFQLAVVVPLLVWLAIDVPTNAEALAEGAFWLWLAAVIVVEVIPVPAWGGLQLSLGFPILLAVAIIYPPSVAALIALVGSVDPREFTREVSFLKAVFNRSQMAASILAGSAIFHAIATIDSPVVRLIPALLLAAVVAYGLNALFIATLTGIDRRLPVLRVLVKMHGTAPYEFLLTYVGLGVFGAVIARFYDIEGFWSVVVFLAPLVFARQMYFRSRALADRLAEQNELLAKQAQRLETLLEKEHENVAALRELNRMKEEFVAVVSHELRTPVTALIGYAKTLRQPQFAEDPGMREEFLERMERQGDRLLRLVENLLTASNVENKELPMSVGRVRIDDLCREIVEGLASDSDRVRLELDPDVPVLQTDRQLLGRVISNLVDNALKYSPEGTPCELGARGEGEDQVVFWVRDHGVGMAPEELNRIFDRFYQVDSSITRTFRGAGLGLSLVKNLLDHLGGRVDVQSVVGDGSKFTVTLPVTFPGLVAGDPNGASGAQAVAADPASEGEGSETLSPSR